MKAIPAIHTKIIVLPNNIISGLASENVCETHTLQILIQILIPILIQILRVTYQI